MDAQNSVRVRVFSVYVLMGGQTWFVLSLMSTAEHTCQCIQDT